MTTGTHISRLIDYSAPNLTFDGAVALQRQIVRFVGGIRNLRLHPVTRRQIIKWFRSTPDSFVDTQLVEVCVDERLRVYRRSMSSGRRWNGVSVYEVA